MEIYWVEKWCVEKLIDPMGPIFGQKHHSRPKTSFFTLNNIIPDNHKIFVAVVGTKIHWVDEWAVQKFISSRRWYQLCDKK